jgi:hypothetical protein
MRDSRAHSLSSTHVPGPRSRHPLVSESRSESAIAASFKNTCQPIALRDDVSEPVSMFGRSAARYAASIAAPAPLTLALALARASLA